MNVTKVKRILGSCRDVKQLQEVLRYASQRIEALHKRAKDEAADALFRQIKTAGVGATWYAHHKLYAGHWWGIALVVAHIQPRKRVVWIRPAHIAGVWPRRPDELIRLDLQREPCPRAVAEALTGREFK